MVKPIVDLNIYQNDTYVKWFKFQTKAGEPIDVSDRTFNAQIRRVISPWVYDLTIDVSDANIGIIGIEIPANESNFPSGCIWDFQQTRDDVVTTLFKGKVNYEEDVTNV